jgi:phosphatidylglycerol lysyltransferase
MEESGARSVWSARLQALLALALFAVALVVLRHELYAYRWSDLVDAVRALGRDRLLFALALTGANYAALTGYDALAMRIIGVDLGYARIALASFIAYVFSHNVGLSFLGGGAVRYRLYSGWGLAGDQIASVVVLNVVTFWLGFALLLGTILVLDPPMMAHGPALGPWMAMAVGIFCLLVPVAYTGAVAYRRTPIRVRGRELGLPSLPLAAAQLAISAVDWLLAGTVLYVLIPLPDLGFARFMGVFLLAQVAGLASNVPAGLGVFETVMLLLVAPGTAQAAVVGGLLAYRAIYYLLPLLVGVVLLVGHETAGRTQVFRRVGRAFGRLPPGFVPQALALLTFAAGGVLLVSGGTPADLERLGPLADVLGLPVIEVSHFTGSVVGVGLLLLARGLQLRLDAAYLLATALLGAGIVASLLKGFDYEEALVLTAVLLVLLPCRRQFYRRASLLDEPLTTPWLVAVGLAVLGTGWLMDLSFRHVEYQRYLWWQFELSADAPRSLRAAAGVLGVLGAYGVARLLHPAQPRPHAPTADELAAVARVVEASPNTSAWLALLGDKHFVLNDARSAFVMYAIEGRSWIAMGDPIGTPNERREVAWEFYEVADRHAGWPVFYEVSERNLALYLDLGLTLQKLGEEARVFLPEFSLDGGSRKSLRQNHTKLARACALEIVPPAAVPALLPELRSVSDAWLAEKQTREKSFSLGAFLPAYLGRMPMALVRVDGRVVAFANTLPGGEHEECSVDLMRHLPDAPPGVMDYLFVELMLRGKADGYRWFNLGMAPLSGLEQRALAPLWTKVGAFVFRYGDSFYNFQGLRHYKEKFGPQWTPRYLASPGGVALPLVLANVASLVSGGLRGVVAK